MTEQTEDLVVDDVVDDVTDTDAESQGEDPPTTPEAPVAPEWSEDDAEQAKAFGWKAPDEWAGDKPPGYIDDPRRYLERAENFKPFAKLKEQSERERQQFDERMRKMEAITEQSMKALQARHERERADIEAEQRKAVEMADTEQYDALEKRKASLGDPIDVPTPAAPPAIDPEFAAYAEANDWMKNPVLRNAGRDIIDANPHMLHAKPIEQAKFAEAEVRKLYPGAFEAPAPERTAPPRQRVDGGGLGAGKGSDPLAKLPTEARQAFKKFKEQGLFKDTPEDRKRYADDYNAA